MFFNNGKIDQIAFISDGEETTELIKARLGLQDSEWTEDAVYATGRVHGEPGGNTAKLLFNYDGTTEVEILEYLAGPNYAANLTPGSLCHIGIHVGQGLEAVNFPYPVIQEVYTQTHTNPFLLETGRKYHYTIYDTFQDMGVYLKVIERIEPGA